MPTFEKYQLQRLASRLRQDVCIDGRDLGTGTPITIHYLSSENPGEDDALLLKTEMLAPEFRQKVLEVGYDSGTPFVVTESLADGISVRTWLQESLIRTQTKSVAKERGWSHREVWAIPVPPDAEQTPAIPATIDKNSGAGGPSPGEFTQLIRLAAAEPGSLEPPPLVPQPAPPLATTIPQTRAHLMTPSGMSPATEQETGEFTRLLRSSGGGLENSAVSRPAAAKAPAIQPVRVEPAKPVALAAPPPALAVSSPQPPVLSPPPGNLSDSGDFTNFLQSLDSGPVQPAPVPVVRTPQPSFAAESLFPETPRPVTPMPATASDPLGFSPAAHDFPWAQEVPQGQPPGSRNADATKIFSRPINVASQPGQQAFASSAGPGEYTRLTQQDEAVAAPAGKAGPASAKQGAIPSKSFWQAYLPLIAVLTILLLLAIVAIVIMNAQTRQSG
ncbi:MAG: hypothetical protein H7039_07405 [Bryobacteraceae bacterium]|nr:hypothetical protein [Bryobacteraceae bacterium]